MSELDHIWEKCRPHFSQQRVADRAHRLMVSQLTCFGRHTITGMLCAGGRQFVDWSADYRLFERKRIDENALFTIAQREVEATLDKNQPLVVAMDDSLLRKKAKTSTALAGGAILLAQRFTSTWSGAKESCRSARPCPTTREKRA